MTTDLHEGNSQATAQNYKSQLWTLNLIRITVLAIVILSMTAGMLRHLLEGYFAFRHDRYMDRLLRILTEPELVQLIKAERDLGFDSKSIVKYIQLIDALSGQHGLARQYPLLVLAGFQLNPPQPVAT